jgi:hypothetical protein
MWAHGIKCRTGEAVGDDRRPRAFRVAPGAGNDLQVSAEAARKENAMGRFLEREKAHQSNLKRSSLYFSDAAREDGIYTRKAYSFCLPLEYAEENLFPGIRESAPAYFASNGIKWHDGHGRWPSNHLCSSQVCCVNFLFPFADQPRALAEVLRPVFPAIRKMLPVEDGQYVAFEWIGQENYLNEKSRDGKRTRGANFTSADAAVMFERADGKRQIVLIEWKYTESYGGTPLTIAKSGTDRTAIYKKIFDCVDCPIDKKLLPEYESLFFEPFYQFMRQQFLAYKMEQAQEMGASAVTVLHIAPACNRDFHKVTSPNLAALGETATGIWRRLAQPPGVFISISTEELFGKLSVEQLPEMQAWLDYIYMRYPLVRAGTAAVS